MSISRDYAVTDLLAVVRAGAAWSFGSTGVLAEAAANTLRQDYDPATLGYRGVLVEVAATNQLTNPRHEGGVAGTPGTVPTGWVVPANPARVTREIVGLGTEDGIPYIDLRWYGTPGSTINRDYMLVGAAVVAAVAGETWMHSAPMRLVAGTTANIVISQLVMGRDSGGAPMESSVAAVTASLGVDALRKNIVTASRTLTSGTTAFVHPGVRFGFTIGAAVDITLRIGAPQLWKSAVAFSPSLPPVGTPGASTRAADDLSMSPIGSWFSADQGTIVIDFMPGQSAPPDARGIIAVDDRTAGNMFDVRMVAGGLTVRLEAASGGVTQVAALDAGAATLLTRNTLRLSYGPAGYLVSLNGAAPVSAGLGTAPAGLSRVRLGNRAGASPFALNGWLGPRVQHYPVQYTDTPASDGFTIRNR